MNKIISIISKTILYIFGWNPLDEHILTILKNNKYLVCVFSHTSYYDFFFMVLYYLSYPDELQYLKTLIKPDYFNYIGWFLYKIGGIPSTHISQKNGGATDKIIQVLKSYPSSQLLISPKGTILKGAWRTGYYHIAQALKAPLIAIGVDYELKKVIIGQLIDHQLSNIEIQHKLYQDLGKIVPLYPDREMMKIRNYDKNNLNVIHPEKILNMYLLLMISISYIYIR